MKDMGNPFMDETGDLFTLDTKSIAHPLGLAFAERNLSCSPLMNSWNRVLPLS
jgi:hypothetical protein